MFKKILLRLRDVFGFKRNTKYVGDYLDTANMRSSIYMSVVIAALETWLVFRQLDKYIIPQLSEGNPLFKTVFINTSNFWLLMSLGIVMFVYSLLYISGKKTKGRLLTTVIVASVSIAICLMIPFEFRFARPSSARTSCTLPLPSVTASPARATSRRTSRAR